MTSHSAAAVLLDTNMSPPPNDSESAFVKDNAKFFEDVLEKALVPKIFHDPALSTAEKTLLSEHRAGTPPHKMCARTYYTMKERLEAKGGLDGPDAVARLESVFACQYHLTFCDDDGASAVVQAALKQSVKSLDRRQDLEKQVRLAASRLGASNAEVSNLGSEFDDLGLVCSVLEALVELPVNKRGLSVCKRLKLVADKMHTPGKQLVDASKVIDLIGLLQAHQYAGIHHGNPDDMDRIRTSVNLVLADVDNLRDRLDTKRQQLTDANSATTAAVGLYNDALAQVDAKEDERAQSAARAIICAGELAVERARVRNLERQLRDLSRHLKGLESVVSAVATEGAECLPSAAKVAEEMVDGGLTAVVSRKRKFYGELSRDVRNVKKKAAVVASQDHELADVQVRNRDTQDSLNWTTWLFGVCITIMKLMFGEDAGHIAMVLLQPILMKDPEDATKGYDQGMLLLMSSCLGSQDGNYPEVPEMVAGFQQWFAGLPVVVEHGMVLPLSAEQTKVFLKAVADGTTLDDGILDSIVASIRQRQGQA